MLRTTEVRNLVLHIYSVVPKGVETNFEETQLHCLTS